MTFLTPWTALLTALVAVPLLLLLYFLKLRRRTLRIPSTLLWRSVTQDLEANAPFQRLRWNLLMLIQLLALAALLLALAEPRITAAGSSASRQIIIIDRSASMNALDVGDAENRRTRLDEARRIARGLIEDVGTRGGPGAIMLLAFGSAAQVLSPFDSRRDVLLEALGAVEPTDEAADLEAAFQLAGAFATRDESAAEQLPEVVLISDGGVGEPTPGGRGGGFSVRCSAMRFIIAAPPESAAINNIGIVALGARRSYDDPARVEVFARLINAGPQPATTSVRLAINGEPGPAKTITIPPIAAGESSGDARDGSVSFTLDLSGTSEDVVLGVVCAGADALGADNSAWVVLPQPKPLRLALVHPDSTQETPGRADPVLRNLLKAIEPESLFELPRAAYESIDPASIDAAEQFDLIVFDRVGIPTLPEIPTITFGATAGGAALQPPAPEGAGQGRRILSWERTHPVMRHVGLDDLLYANAGAFELPASASPLAFGPDGPVIALIPTRAARHVAIAFALKDSTWWKMVSQVVFLRNAVDFLTLAGAAEDGLMFRPGEAIVVRPLPGAASISITGPVETTIPLGGAARSGGAAGGGPISLPVLRRVGVYRVAGVAEPMQSVALSLLSEGESDIRPRLDLTINAQTMQAAGDAAAVPRELWPWLALAALGLLVIEWVVYCVRVRRGAGTALP